MTQPTPIRSVRPSKSEEGYILVAVIFLLALFTIALAVALPKVIKEIQRDRELETMHRGKQYIRGVRMYYKKFNAYPPNIDALVKPTNNIKFMRKKYADPTTGKEEWKPVRFGQNKAPTVMGFFGQPIGGIGGCPPANPLSTTTTQGGLSSGGIGGTSSSTTGSSTSSSSNCAPASSSTSSDTSTSTSGTTPTDPNATNTNTTTSTTTGPAAGSTTGMNGQTFGGAGIIGFSPNSPKESIMVYKTKHHYNEWEFVYDPIVEQMMQGGNAGNNAGLQQNPAQNPTQNPNPSPNSNINPNPNPSPSPGPGSTQ